MLGNQDNLTDKWATGTRKIHENKGLLECHYLL